MKFRILMSCSGEGYAYTAGQIVTLGVDLTEEVLRDLLRAGHVEKLESFAERPAIASR